MTATAALAVLETADLILELEYPGLLDAVTADAAVEVVAASGTPDGWGQLISILDENRAYAAADTGPPTTCPNDGTALTTGPHGERFCVFDGFGGAARSPGRFWDDWLAQRLHSAPSTSHSMDRSS